jgi:membrane protein DedA with SNARE-associated domain
LEDIIASLSTYGYIFLFFYSLGGGFIGLAVAGFLASSGEMDITTSITIAIIANFLGDIMLFYITKYQKSEMMVYIKKHRRKLAYAHLFMKKYGDSAIFIQKYIYGVKTLIPIAIALTKYDAKRFIIFNFFASIVWGVVVGTLAYSMGEIFISYIQSASEYNYYIIGAVFLIIFYFFYINKTK